MTNMTGRVAARAAALCLMMTMAGASRATVRAQARTYSWYAELVSIDRSAGTVTVRADAVPAIARYVTEFKPGQPVVLTWIADDGDAIRIISIATPDAMKVVDVGYILPAEFVSADPAGPTVTFKTAAPAAALQAAGAAQPGKWIKVTAPMSQPGPTAQIASIAATEKPQPKVRATGPAVDVAGVWAVAASMAGNKILNDCTLVQSGSTLTGTCGKLPLTGEISLRTVDFQYQIIQGGMPLDFQYSGTLGDDGKTMKGTLTVFGMTSEFTAVKK
jgi:hypothetical protein